MHSSDDKIDEVVRRRFEAAWAAGTPLPIESFVSAGDQTSFLPTLEELVLVEMEFAWKAWAHRRKLADPESARPTSVEEYLQRFPQLNSPDVLQRLVEHESLVRNQCGDRPDMKELEQRFPQLGSISGRLETMVVESFTDASTHSELALKDSALSGLPTRFGGYELLGEIGRGAMGVVYRARQVSADRIVALKVIRRDHLKSLERGSQSNIVERFRHEAHAAARLDHDHIVTVFEVGDVDGDPFFSMRYVEGKSLAEILRGGPMDCRRAAGYLEPVARAVHEAHVKGILHRDIKPQNILVDDKTDHALVADFGLAKLLEGTDELTRAGEMMGTPAYMSPEQVRDAASVTGQSDIYSLGATFYQLLTGRPPFQAATIVETTRQVIDEEPVPPSRLNRDIDKDLDTICLKCLNKDPSQRYGSSAALADDLRRYLDRKPIVARPLGPLARSFRWCRRNRMVAGSLAMAVVFLLAALAATSIGFASTTAALKKSERSYRQARAVVNEFFRDVSDNVLLNQPGLQPLRKLLLGRALPHYRRFLNEGRGDRSLNAELGKTHFRVGLIIEETESAKSALAPYEQALGIQNQLFAKRDSDPSVLYDLAATWNAIGRVQAKLGHPDEALEAFEEAKRLRGKLVAPDEDNREYQRVLANAQMNCGLARKAKKQFDEARQDLQSAQNIRKELLEGKAVSAEDETELLIWRDYASGYYNLSNLAYTQARQSGVRLKYLNAETFIREAISIYEELRSLQPNDFEAQRRLANSYQILGGIMNATGELHVAEDPYRRAAQIAQQLAILNPRVSEYRMLEAAANLDLGRLRYKRGLSESKRGNDAAAESLFTQSAKSHETAKSVLQSLMDKEPLPRHRRNLSMTFCGLAEVRIEQQQWQGARNDLRSARRILEDGPRADFSRELGVIHKIERTLASRHKFDDQEKQGECCNRTGKLN